MMDEYVTKEQVVEWFRPYGHTDEGIPYYGLVTDVREMKAADVAPVVHGRWIERQAPHAIGGVSAKCSVCGKSVQYLGNPLNYCPNCGAKMDGGFDNGEMG